MAYLAVTLNHFRPIQAWARSTGASASLDMSTFELELKTRNRYYRLHPRFLVKRDGAMGHSPELTADVIGFIGWLPYTPLRWEISNDKLQFKTLLRGAGQATPESTEGFAAAPWDFVLKRSIGSFGRELAGPFRAGRTADELARQMPPQGNPAAKLYAERFIAGTNVKVWFWGATPFHAHRNEYPQVSGNGTTSLRDLVARRVNAVGLGDDARSALAALPADDRNAMDFSIAYQGVAWDDALAAGQSVWLDYRYGRTYETGAASNKSDNALQTFTAPVRKRIDSIGELLADAIKPQVPVPVLFSVDGVLDANGELWWLEMNSNPILPPEGYPLMLASLFGPSAGPSVQSVSGVVSGRMNGAAAHEQIVVA